MTVILWIIGAACLIWLYIFAGRLIFNCVKAEKARCYLDWDDDLIAAVWPIFLAFYVAECQANAINRRRIRREREEAQADAAWREFKGGGK